MDQGIRESFTHGLIWIPIYTILCIIFLSIGDWIIRVPTLLFFSLIGGIVISLFTGGWRACLQHLILRLPAWRLGALPWNYARFLDYAAELDLLRKIGGGYRFRHREFQEYLIASSPDQHQPNPIIHQRITQTDPPDPSSPALVR